MPFGLALWLASATLQNTTALAQADPDRVSVTFSKREAQHDVPLAIVKGCILIQAGANGRTVWMLIDNGAERSFIDSTLASAVGLTIENATGNVNTLGGKTPKRIARGVRIDIPGQFTSIEPMYSIDLKAASDRFGLNIGVVIGHDLLSLMAVGVNAQTQKLFFVPGNVQVSGSETGSLSIVPLERAGDKDLTAVRVNGRDIRVLIDLGYGGLIRLAPDASLTSVHSQPAVNERHLVGANGEEIAVTKEEISTLVVGKITYNNVEADVSPITGLELSGVLGAGLLNRQQFLLDVKGSKLYLRPF